MHAAHGDTQPLDPRHHLLRRLVATAITEMAVVDLELALDGLAPLEEHCMRIEARCRHDLVVRVAHAVQHVMGLLILETHLVIHDFRCHRSVHEGAEGAINK